MEAPFVGPRPFGQENTIYGRDSEISELRYFVGAKRIVLLNSPSGAGKSSVANRFVWSAINEFEKSRSGGRRSPEEVRRFLP